MSSCPDGATARGWHPSGGGSNPSLNCIAASPPEIESCDSSLKELTDASLARSPTRCRSCSKRLSPIPRIPSWISLRHERIDSRSGVIHPHLPTADGNDASGEVIQFVQHRGDATPGWPELDAANIDKRWIARCPYELASNQRL